MTIEKANGPSGAATPTRAGAIELVSPSHREHTHPRRNVKPGITIRVLPDGDPVSIPGGRAAETMRLLILHGARGFTSGEASVYRWARRTSEYIRGLRVLGVPIVTRREHTSDGSWVGRYILDAEVQVVRDAACEAANDE
jgi:Winged helix domain